MQVLKCNLLHKQKYKLNIMTAAKKSVYITKNTTQKYSNTLYS